MRDIRCARHDKHTPSIERQFRFNCRRLYFWPIFKIENQCHRVCANAYAERTNFKFIICNVGHKLLLYVIHKWQLIEVCLSVTLYNELAYDAMLSSRANSSQTWQRERGGGVAQTTNICTVHTTNKHDPMWFIANCLYSNYFIATKSNRAIAFFAIASEKPNRRQSSQCKIGLLSHLHALKRIILLRMLFGSPN